MYYITSFQSTSTIQNIKKIVEKSSSMMNNCASDNEARMASPFTTTIKNIVNPNSWLNKLIILIVFPNFICKCFKTSTEEVIRKEFIIELKLLLIAHKMQTNKMVFRKIKYSKYEQAMSPNKITYSSKIRGIKCKIR